MIQKVEIQDQVLDIEGFECMCAVTGYENSCGSDPESTAIFVDDIKIVCVYETDDIDILFELQEYLHSDFTKYSNIIEERIN